MASSRTQSTLERLRSLTKRSKNQRRYVSEFNNSEYTSWTMVDLNKLPKKETLIPNSVNSNVIWCEDNCQDEFVFYRKCIYFKNQDDAAFFLVIWQ
jgi:hypothetical protein